MSVRRLGRIAIGAIALLMMASPASGLAASATTITIAVGENGEGPFTATGGVLCPSGTSSTEFGHFGGGGAAGSFHLTKDLVCADGSGTFTIRVHAATVLGSPTDQGGWSVVGGTGDYVGLSGGGNLVGTYVPNGIIDVYTGVVQG